MGAGQRTKKVLINQSLNLKQYCGTTEMLFLMAKFVLHGVN